MGGNFYIIFNFQARWQSAFTPNGQFSGNLPVLETGDGELSQLYYMSALTVISSLRTNMNAFERVFITGFGGMSVDVDNQVELLSLLS